MKDWWDFIHPGYGLVEIRSFHTSGSKDRFWVTNISEYHDSMVEDGTGGWDVYYGVLPRKESGKGTSEDCWPTTTVLWADVDAKKFCPDPVLHDPVSKLKGAWDDDKAKALDTILQFPLTPSAIVDSGHGYHCYWKLEAPVEFKDAEYVMRGIAKWLNGDATYDQARILRVPGTTNWKDPENPVPVRLLKLDHTRKYELSDFAEITACLEVPTVRPTRDSDRRQDAPDMLKELIDSDPPKGTRSEVLYHAVAWMKELGYSFDEALMVVMNSPVGAKAQERGERWAEGEVGRIWRKVP